MQFEHYKNQIITKNAYDCVMYAVQGKTNPFPSGMVFRDIWQYGQG